jgi:hypothetical protein
MQVGRRGDYCCVEFASFNQGVEAGEDDCRLRGAALQCLGCRRGWIETRSDRRSPIGCNSLAVQAGDAPATDKR